MWYSVDDVDERSTMSGKYFFYLTMPRHLCGPILSHVIHPLVVADSWGSTWSPADHPQKRHCERVGFDRLWQCSLQ